MSMVHGPSLDGRHALVTGGAGGIGAAVAHALQADGARVTLLGRDVARLEHALRDLNPDRCARVRADITVRAEVDAAFAEAAQRFGAIDVLVNNAGQAASAPFGKTDDALWRQMMAVNLDGVFHCTQAALPGMLAGGWGRIVNVASTAALTGYRYVAAYCAAKHGVLGLTRALALELAGKGITVNAVCLGYTETGIVRDAVANIAARTGRTQEAARAELASGNPQGRLVQPEEVADAVAWLCRPQASAMNGQAIAVAGGEVM
jgi:NAD(P)-dependent dehydrogenase (short-subunit alcohol dehydrogenase family)